MKGDYVNDELARLLSHNADCRCDISSGSYTDWTFHTLCSLRKLVKDRDDCIAGLLIKLSRLEQCENLVAERQALEALIAKWREREQGISRATAADDYYQGQRCGQRSELKACADELAEAIGRLTPEAENLGTGIRCFTCHGLLEHTPDCPERGRLTREEQP